MYITIIGNFLVGFSETLLVLITSMLITGRKDLLNIRNWVNTLKLLIVTLVLALIIISNKDLLGKFTTLAFIALYIITCIFIFKIHWIEAAAGVLISIISLVAFESISILIISKLIGITFNGQEIDSRFRLYVCISTRILQIILYIIFYKLPISVINFKQIKFFARKTLRRLTLIYIYEAFCIIMLLKISWSQVYNGKILSTMDMTVNISLICIFFVLNIIVITKMMRNTILEKKNNTITLLWFKHLLAHYKYDIDKIDQMVDMALKNEVEGGKFDEK